MPKLLLNLNLHPLVMTEIRRAKTYSVDVFAGGMPVATGLPLRVKKESGSEKNIL